MTDATDDLQGLLRAARRSEDPSEADREAVRAGVATRLAAAAGTAAAIGLVAKGATAAGGAASSSVAIIATWVLAGAALGGAVSGLAVAARSADEERAAVVVRDVPATRVAPARHTGKLGVAPRAEETPAAEPPATPLRATEAPRRAPAPPAADTLLEESAALREVQAALRGGRPAEALELLDGQARRFPQGALAEERAASRVFALCAAGRQTEARNGAARFFERYPDSLLGDRVKESCRDR